MAGPGHQKIRLPPLTITPTYDLDGNLTSDGRWDYTWDAENRLASMQTAAIAYASSVGVPRQKLDYTYDGQGRRVAKTVYSTTNLTSSPTWTFVSSQRFLYDEWNLIAEYSATSATGTTLTLQASHTWGIDLSGSQQGAGGVGGLLASHLLNPAATAYPAYDGNGNITAWIDTNGAILGRKDYSPFGQLVANYKLTGVSTTLTRLPFGFSTKYTESESGLLYYGYRYYDPVNGRWPSRDPIQELAFWNSSKNVNNLKNILIDKFDERLNGFENKDNYMSLLGDFIAWTNGEIDSIRAARQLGMMEKLDYAFVLNKGVNDIDIYGLDRQIMGEGAHQFLALEDWKEVNGKWVKEGVTEWNFGPRTYAYSFISLATLLPVPGLVWTFAGGFDDPFESNPCQDMLAKKKLSKAQANPPFYSFWGFNCRDFAQVYYSIGMYDEKYEKCCNPDGTDWER